LDVRSICRVVLALGLLLPLACQGAGRYPAPGSATNPETPAEVKLPPHWAWLPIQPRPDVPIRFIAPTHAEWDTLPRFWNHFPPVPAGMRTIHLGLPALQAAAALVAADQLEVIKIKVPRGLPDPNPLISAANLPTFGRWRLGKKLFSEPLFHVGADVFACITCHQPDHGFAQPRNVSLHGTRNTQSLLNVVYIRQQFWDGRVRALEETLARSLEDEQVHDDSVLTTHRWGGIVKTLAEDKEYRAEFQRVFGIEQPTQDTIAKAVATYLRTLMSGDSLVDRADAERAKQKSNSLAAEHFLPLLDEKTLQMLGVDKMAKDETARKLARGSELFHGKARCAVCHPGPLYTDHGYHNVGLGEKDDPDTSRFGVVPIGLKEARFIGAFRTPTLRALSRTAPYFHDGKRRTLREVVAFFNLHVDTVGRA
jgi:cytochrome c peroxidase